jgi:methyltransferase (TIGR00027 family)
MDAPRVETISDTAFPTAHARAVESERPDALFTDPLAARLLTERGRALGESLQGSFLRGWSIDVRTVMIDDFIVRAIASGADSVLNLGAGLDTRPYRMDIPSSVRWVEVDQPHVIQFKEERLKDQAPRCQLERFGLDILDVASRRRVFADVQSRSQALLVVAEGVILYFPNDLVGSLAADLHALSGVQGWIVDHIPAAVLAFRNSQPPAAQSENMQVLFNPPDWFGFFEQHGWKAGAVCNLFDEGLRLGRPMPLPPGARPPAPTSGATDAADHNRAFPGYVALQPVR